MKPSQKHGMRRRWLALLAGWIGMAPAAACHHSEAEAHAVRPETAMTQSAGQIDPLRDRRREALKHLHRTLAEVDEQIEMLDAIIEGREETRDPEDEYEETTKIYESMYATRAVVAEQHARALAAIDRVRVAGEAEWLKVSWAARMELGELEDSYNLAVKSLYR